MTYTPYDLDLITIADDLAPQSDKTKEFQEFISNFPEHLSLAKSYFENYHRFLTLSYEVLEINKRRIAKKRENLKTSKNSEIKESAGVLEYKLNELEHAIQKTAKTIYSIFATGLRYKDDLNLYLKNHFYTHIHPVPKIFQDEVNSEEIETLRSHGFHPAYTLKTEEDEFNAFESPLLEPRLQQGAQAGNLINRIQMASCYLTEATNFRKKKKDLHANEDIVVNWLFEGLRKSMPEAISKTWFFATNFLALCNDYSKSPNKILKSKILELKDLGIKLCLALCKDERQKTDFEGKLKYIIKLIVKGEMIDSLDRFLIKSMQKAIEENSKTVLTMNIEKARDISSQLSKASMECLLIEKESRISLAVNTIVGITESIEQIQAEILNQIEVYKRKYQDKYIPIEDRRNIEILTNTNGELEKVWTNLLNFKKETVFETVEKAKKDIQRIISKLDYKVKVLYSMRSHKRMLNEFWTRMRKKPFYNIGAQAMALKVKNVFKKIPIMQI